MPIPDFTADGLLPPYKGNPGNQAEISPYPATTLELCKRLSKTQHRREILKGFLKFRALLRKLQITEGFQWVDGSFVEEVERRTTRPPKDIQVVTFCNYPALIDDPAFANDFDLLADLPKLRSQFHVDHTVVKLDWSPNDLVKNTNYWSGRLSHHYDTGTWKGLLRIDLHTTSEDNAAMHHLTSLERS